VLLLAVGVGGALGAYARHRATAWVHRWSGTGFPWGTLAVNVIGSLLLGALLAQVAGRPGEDLVRASLSVGLLGSFTTFSTFSYEAVSLVHQGSAGRAVSYVLSSLALGLGAFAAGFLLLAP
jgi:fluoride exporter